MSVGLKRKNTIQSSERRTENAVNAYDHYTASNPRKFSVNSSEYRFFS